MWADLEPIGRDPDSGGYRRYAWTAEDQLLREWFAGECAARGLELVEDRAGNQWGWWGDPDASPAPAWSADRTSTRCPTVAPSTARSAWSAPLRPSTSCGAGGVAPMRPLGVVNFVDEEGARFGVACAGSRLITGRLDAERALGLRGDDGRSLAEVLRSRRPAARARRRRPGGIAPHRVLRRASRRAGPGSGRAVIRSGSAPTSGPTVAGASTSAARPTTRAPRVWRTAGTRCSAFAELVLAARAAAAEHDCLATVGKVRVQPGGVNAIARAGDGMARRPRRRRGARPEPRSRDRTDRAADRDGRVVEESWTPANLVQSPSWWTGSSGSFPTRRCSAPAPGTTPASWPPRGSRRRCCSSATRPASPTPPPNGPSRPTAGPGWRRWPPC